MGNEGVIEEFNRDRKEHKVSGLEGLFGTLVMLRAPGVDTRSVDEANVAVPVVLRDHVGGDPRTDGDLEHSIRERLDESRLSAAVVAGEHQERSGMSFDGEPSQQRLTNGGIEVR